ncbi:MAG: peptide chain release factor 2 [Acholeplasmataceae bacterium]
MERYEINKILESFRQSLEDLARAIDPDKLQKEYQQLNLKMQAPNFWQDQNNAKKITQKANTILDEIETLSRLERQFEGIEEWFEISEEATEEWLILEKDLNEFLVRIREFEVRILLNGPYDQSNAILELHSGAGGTESQDWCEMLLRMYQRYAQKKGFKVEVLDYQDGEEAGIKSVTLLIKGPFAYGYLQSERGVHRLVRISPFDSNARRHTSFASVDVVPEIDETIEIEIKDEDLKIDVYRSSGAGGQSVNTTDSAVRITHLPTNTVITCQNERSQIKNKEAALNVLKSKLLQLEIQKQEDQLKKIKGEQKDIAWGSQIRSYVFQPYQMVKDHRTDYEVGQVDQVMNGDLDGFINAYLKTKG